MPWYSSRSYYPKTAPRRAAEGVQAKSRKGEIGETWWSRRFVTVLESFTDRSRLQRGRSYARSGQVIGLDVTAGAATARVQGSRPRPYEVRIEVTALSTKDWTAVEEALASRALFAARLRAGEDALALRFRPDADARPDMLARRLGPVVGDTRDLARHLAPAWGRIAEHARKRALDE